MADEATQDNATPTGGEGESAQKPNLAELLKDEAIRSELSRLIQSEADKRASTIEKNLRRQLVDEAEARRKAAEDEELRALAKNRDFNDLGERVAGKLLEEDSRMKVAEEFTAGVERFLMENPEFRSIGEEKVQEVYTSIKSRNGSVLDLIVELSKEKANTSAASAYERARQENRQELEALLAEYGLQKRTQDAAEGNAPSQGVSGQAGDRATTASDNEILDAYNRGEDVPREKVLEILKKQGIDLGVKIPRK